MAANNNKKSTTSNKKREYTPFEIECYQVVKMIEGYKNSCEANVCTLLYKDPSKLYDSNLTLDEFSNNTWRVYFEIIKDIILVEHKNTVDEIIVGIYLDKHPKLKKEYDDAGGYDVIENSGNYIKIEAFDGYLEELRKWNAVLKIAKRGWINKSKLPQYVDKKAEDIYKEYYAFINDTFVNINNDVKSYDISHGIDELIESLDEGVAVGLPYYNMPTLTQETAGQYQGSITLVGGLSNVGKSTFARTTTLMSIIERNERIVVMLNEDGISKWQRELLVLVANVIFKHDIQKHVLRNGKFSDETKDILRESAMWIKEKTKNRMITVIPFQEFKTATAIKAIRKYAAMGVNYFLLDTFKLDAGNVNDNSWLQLQQNMVAINDVIKPESLNVHILITFQLSKGNSARQRYYTQDNVGMAKNMIDTASTVIMIRDVFEDEYTGKKRALDVYRLEGINGKTKVPQVLHEDKKYQIIFIIKNREGSANRFQIVIEHDMSKNIMREIGICHVPVDF